MSVSRIQKEYSTCQTAIRSSTSPESQSTPFHAYQKEWKLPSLYCNWPRKRELCLSLALYPNSPTTAVLPVVIESIPPSPGFRLSSSVGHPLSFKLLELAHQEHITSHLINRQNYSPSTLSFTLPSFK
ncbi:hypothetical protein E6O75_ATG08496 [Venturia nashicola]|uniref:Uncharacterized protein n=1 Tax=Venturia nashicola TaxID=86259 RepID=A0A4Z1NI57_9PEZI|nr:hypothetical protein E6O75_ATG08496 [Venturia nashicola]